MLFWAINVEEIAVVPIIANKKILANDVKLFINLTIYNVTKFFKLIFINAGSHR